MNICFKSLIQQVCRKVCEAEENSAAINQAENRRKGRGVPGRGETTENSKRYCHVLKNQSSPNIYKFKGPPFPFAYGLD